MAGAAVGNVAAVGAPGGGFARFNATGNNKSPSFVSPSAGGSSASPFGAGNSGSAGGLFGSNTVSCSALARAHFGSLALICLSQPVSGFGQSSFGGSQLGAAQFGGGQFGGGLARTATSTNLGRLSSDPSHSAMRG